MGVVCAVNILGDGDLRAALPASEDESDAVTALALPTALDTRIGDVSMLPAPFP